MSPLSFISTLDIAGYSYLHVLVSILWQSSILLTIVGVITYFLRKRGVSLRFALWVTAIVAIPLLPLLSKGGSELGTPQTEISVMPVYSAPQLTVPPIILEQPYPPDYRLDNNTPYSLTQPPYDIPFPQNIPQEEHRKFDIKTLAQYPWAIAFTVYSLVAILFLAMITIGKMKLRNWIMNGEAVIDNRVLATFQRVQEKLQITQDILIVENSHIPAPMTYNILKPVVILPTGLVETLSDEELREVAFHELSHVKRNDAFTLTLVSLIRAIFFFHPLVWFAARQVSFLAEIACDNAVVEATGDTIPYAEMLTRLADNIPEKGYSTEVAMGIIFSKSAFFRRIEILLSAKREKIQRLSRFALAGTVAGIVLSLVTAIAFPLGDKKAEEKVTISGKVLHEGNPVAKAKVYAIERKYEIMGKSIINDTAKTKKDGTFSLSVSKEVFDSMSFSKQLSVVAYHPRYAFGWIQLNNEKKFENITLTLDKPTSLDVKVLDKNGNPLQNAELTHLTTQVTKGEYGNVWLFALFPEVKKKTNKQGIFTLQNIPENASLTLTVSCTGYINGSFAQTPPGIKSVTITLEPEGRISGRATLSTTGEPVKNTTILCYNGVATTDNQGFYTIYGLKPGTNKVKAKFPNNSIDKFPVWVSPTIENVNVEQNKTTYLNIQFIKGGIITGRITDKDTGEPIPDQSVQIINPEKDEIMPFDTDWTDKNGKYCLFCVPGKMKLTSYPLFTGNYIQDITPEQNYRFVDVSEDKIIRGVDFQFSKGIGIKGKVFTTDGTSVQGTSIKTSFRNNWCIAEKNGQFTLTGFKPGDKITLYAKNSEQQFRSSLIDIEVQPNIEIDILLDKYEITDIEGTVIDTEGKPVPNVGIKLYDYEYGIMLGHGWFHAISDETGNFTIKDMIIGDKYQLSAQNEQVKTEIFTVKENMPPLKFVIPKVD